MDRVKTGALIAQTRKERDLTQKELAVRLHVSDRAVSKWERGAGFPDVSLLEPLAEALDLTVLDLLRGERTEETDVHAAVQEALKAVQEKQRRDRYELRIIQLKLAAWVVVLILMGLWIFPFQKEVNETVTAGVYVDGALAAYTEVEIQGEISHFSLTGKRSYWGRFAIGCVEWTTREEANAGLSLNGGDGLIYSMGGTLAADLYDPATVISADVTEFAFALRSPHRTVNGQPRPEQWCVLATSPDLYEAYYAGIGHVPPPLDASRTAVLPEFPSAWRRIP